MKRFFLSLVLAVSATLAINAKTASSETRRLFISFDDVAASHIVYLPSDPICRDWDEGLACGDLLATMTWGERELFEHEQNMLAYAWHIDNTSLFFERQCERYAQDLRWTMPVNMGNHGLVYPTNPRVVASKEGKCCGMADLVEDFQIESCITPGELTELYGNDSAFE